MMPSLKRWPHDQRSLAVNWGGGITTGKRKRSSCDFLAPQKKIKKIQRFFFASSRYSWRFVAFFFNNWNFVMMLIGAIGSRASIKRARTWLKLVNNEEVRRQRRMSRGSVSRRYYRLWGHPVRRVPLRLVSFRAASISRRDRTRSRVLFFQDISISSFSYFFLFRFGVVVECVSLM